MAERRTTNALLAAGGEQLRARARQLCRENPYASNACEAYAAAAVGVGIKPSSLIEDRNLKKAVQKLWTRWTDEADADNVTDFYGLQALAARAMFEAGEVFIRFRPRRLSDGLTVPLQLQLYESEMLAYNKNEGTSNGNVIREGIEFNALGQRVAYWFYKSHPGEVYPVVFDFSFSRVPADQVLHLYRPRRAGDIRGTPQITPAMVRLYLLDLYDDAELERKKTAALFAGFITKKGGNTEPPFPTEPAWPGQGDEPPAGTAIAPLEPGGMQVLEEGESVEFSEPADVGGSYEAFIWRNLLAICAGMGVPYAAVTADTSKSNYSSSREAQVEFRRRIDQVQHAVFVYQMCRPIWQRWFRDAVVSGALPIKPGDFAKAPLDYTDVTWITPKWDWVDPLKDRKAEQLAIDMGVMSRDDAIEAEGNEPEENDRRIQAARQRELKMDLGFRPATIRENVNIAAEADTPDEAVEAVEDGGDRTEDDPKAEPQKPAPAPAKARDPPQGLKEHAMPCIGLGPGDDPLRRRRLVRRLVVRRGHRHPLGRGHHRAGPDRPGSDHGSHQLGRRHRVGGLSHPCRHRSARR